MIKAQTLILMIPVFWVCLCLGVRVQLKPFLNISLLSLLLKERVC